MILVDTNLLVYAKVVDMPQHAAAKTWFDGQLNTLARVGLPWHSLLGFLRIVTNPRIFEHPQSIDSAWRQVTDWLSVRSVWVPAPTDRHAEVLGLLLAAARPRANLVPDAHLAALAIEHGLTLCSTDGDFGRFTGMRWHNPLAT